MKDLNWDTVVQGAHITIYTVAVALNLVSFTFMLKSYMKHIHHRLPNISNLELMKEERVRNVQLGLFVFFEGPMVIKKCLIIA